MPLFFPGYLYLLFRHYRFFKLLLNLYYDTEYEINIQEIFKNIDRSIKFAFKQERDNEEYYKKYYEKLYDLLSRDVFTAKNKHKFLSLLDLSLRSSKVPQKYLKSFIIPF